MANYYSVPFPTFQLAMRNILSIAQGVSTLVTTTYDGINPGAHQYSDGLSVRFVIPLGWGMGQLNQVEAFITVVNDTQFTVPINTTSFDPFLVPPYQPGNFGTPPQVVPVGEINDLLTLATQNVLPYP